MVMPQRVFPASRVYRTLMRQGIDMQRTSAYDLRRFMSGWFNPDHTVRADRLEMLMQCLLLTGAEEMLWNDEADDGYVIRDAQGNLLVQHCALCATPLAPGRYRTMHLLTGVRICARCGRANEKLAAYGAVAAVAAMRAEEYERQGRAHESRMVRYYYFRQAAIWRRVTRWYGAWIRRATESARIDAGITTLRRSHPLDKHDAWMLWDVAERANRAARLEMARVEDDEDDEALVERLSAEHAQAIAHELRLQRRYDALCERAEEALRVQLGLHYLFHP